MSTPRPKKLSALVSVMAFELASAPISKKLDAAEAENATILADLKMAALVKRSARSEADAATADAAIAVLDAKLDAINDVIFALQEHLFELEASLPGLPAVEAMTAAA